MLAPALADPNPVLIFEHGSLYNLEGELRRPAAERRHRARRRPPPRQRRDLIAYGWSVGKALAAAEALAGDGIDAEVIDLRVLRPLDDAAILASVARTHRAVVVDEGWRTGSLAAEVSARIIEGAFYELDAPGPARLQRRGADPLRQAPRGRRAPLARADRRRGARRR